jgi:hypothetical protein
MRCIKSSSKREIYSNKRERRVADVDQWYSACLAYSSPWVLSSELQNSKIIFIDMKNGNFKKAINSQDNHEQKEQSWKLRIPDFKLYYSAVVIKTPLWWH